MEKEKPKRKSNWPFPGGRKFTGACLLLGAAIAKCILAGACDWPTIVIGASGIVAFILGEAWKDREREKRQSYQFEIGEAVELAFKRIGELKPIAMLILPLSLCILASTACSISGTRTITKAQNAALAPDMRAVMVIEAPGTGETPICTAELAKMAEKLTKCDKNLDACEKEKYTFAAAGLLSKFDWYQDLPAWAQYSIRGVIYTGAGAILILFSSGGG